MHGDRIAVLFDCCCWVPAFACTGIDSTASCTGMGQRDPGRNACADCAPTRCTRTSDASCGYAWAGAASSNAATNGPRCADGADAGHLDSCRYGAHADSRACRSHQGNFRTGQTGTVGESNAAAHGTGRSAYRCYRWPIGVQASAICHLQPDGGAGGITAGPTEGGVGGGSNAKRGCATRCSVG